MVGEGLSGAVPEPRRRTLAHLTVPLDPDAWVALDAIARAGNMTAAQAVSMAARSHAALMDAVLAPPDQRGALVQLVPGSEQWQVWIGPLPRRRTPRRAWVLVALGVVGAFLLGVMAAR